MFLNEELLKIAKKADVTRTEEIQKLNADLCEKCEEYYKSRLGDDMSDTKKIKAVLDRTFNLWDSFVRMAEKDSDIKINILAGLFKKHSFRHQFLSNKKISIIYNKLI
ncbi:MAG: hypothetical protein IMY72_11875 [Bacteroidetes bacterium]|nr:hypothetical protein [Bacteroidota bacterium]